MRFSRTRRLRGSGSLRDLVGQTCLLPGELIMPCFVLEGAGRKERIERMSGVFRLSVDNLLGELDEALAAGIKTVLLFGVPGRKDAKASVAYSESGIVQKTVRAIKKRISGMTVITDVCLCAYTAHGHCGIVRKRSGGFTIDNDESIAVLSRIALSHAAAGADFVAPSAMMDGQVGAIREGLDANGFKEAGILAYSAKYCSNFYGPFREALDSAPEFGDRKTYQMDFRNSDEALREIKNDIDEGADIVMVKPALAYLDIISRAKRSFNVPLAAYSVSGEYAMLKEYARDKEEEKRLFFETLTGIKRAGADMIITYYAKEAAKLLKERKF
ncbi:MAG: porphobilinogen synthase [Elusimicrobia bacterium]|nr:porphobilinogen synthase [Elusimicrobiota bacterium]